MFISLCVLPGNVYEAILSFSCHAGASLDLAAYYGTAAPSGCAAQREALAGAMRSTGALDAVCVEGGTALNFTCDDRQAIGLTDACPNQMHMPCMVASCNGHVSKMHA